MQTLSAFTGTPAPQAAPAVNWPKPQADMLDWPSMFRYLNFMLQFAPTHPGEKALMQRFAKVGVGPGKPFDAAALSPEMKGALEAGIADAKKQFAEFKKTRIDTHKVNLITLEPPPPSAAGVVNLYSSDFYALAGSRLRERGLLAQWLPLPTQNDEDTRSLVRSFLDVFPYATLWTTELHEMLLIGSFAPIELDVPRIASPAALLGTWVTDRAGLVRYVDGAPAVTDDQPRIEYATWVRPKEITRVLPRLLGLRTEPPLQGADHAFLVVVADQRNACSPSIARGFTLTTASAGCGRATCGV